MVSAQCSPFIPSAAGHHASVVASAGAGRQKYNPGGSSRTVENRMFQKQGSPHWAGEIWEGFLEEVQTELRLPGQLELAQREDWARNVPDLELWVN